MASEHTIDPSQVTGNADSIPGRLPVLPLRDVVIYPYMIFPVLVGRESSLRAVGDAVERDKYIFLVAQKSSVTEDPGIDDVYQEGTVARIIQVLKLPNGLMKILVDGVIQGRVEKFLPNAKYLEAEVSTLPTAVPVDPELDALLRHTASLFTEYVHLNRNVPSEVLVAFENTREPLRRMFYIAANIMQSVDVKQRILQLTSIREQLHELIRILNSENDVLKIEKEIDTKVHDNIAKSQRKFFIQEQIRILQDELGDEDSSPELMKLREDIRKAKMPKAVEEKALEEFNKLKKTPPLSPESTVIRGYLETMVGVPWHKRTKDNLNIDHVKAILDEDHFGLEKPKERVLEHIAVLNLVREMKGQILCFVGPPGVGKTSLAGLLAKRFSGTQILEDVKNPFLAEFYEGRKGAAFQTQIYFLLSRYGQQQEIAQMDLFKELVIADYTFAKDKIFANLTLSDEEMGLYEKVWVPLSEALPKPDLVIHLTASVDTCLSRIKQRGRAVPERIEMCDGYQHIGELALDLRPLGCGCPVDRRFDLTDVLRKLGDQRVEGCFVLGHVDGSVRLDLTATDKDGAGPLERLSHVVEV